MDFEIPPVASGPKKRGADFENTIVPDRAVSTDEIAEMVAHDVPEAAADPKRRVDVAAEIARKKKLLEHIDTYLSKNSKELMGLSADDQRDENAYQERLEVLNKGSKEWMSRGSDLEEVVARLKQSIGADERSSAGQVPSAGSAVSRGAAPIPRLPLAKPRGFFSTVKDSVNQGLNTLRNFLSSRKQGGYAEEETMFGAGDYSLKDGSMSEVDELETTAYASEVASVSEAADPDQYAKIVAEIKRKKDLIDKIDQYLARLVREMNRSVEGESPDSFQLRFDALNADYAEWRSRSQKFEERLSMLEKMIGRNMPTAQEVSVQETPQEVVSSGRSTSMGGIITAIRNSLPWGAVGMKRRQRQQPSENDQSEAEVRLPSPVENDSLMEENPFPAGQDSFQAVSDETAPVSAPRVEPVAVSGFGAFDMSSERDPFASERYLRGQIPGERSAASVDLDPSSSSAIAAARSERERFDAERLKASMGYVGPTIDDVADRGDLDFEKWAAAQRQKPQMRPFGVDPAMLYPVAEVTAASALADVETIREARKNARDNQLRHPVNAEAYSAEEKVLEESYREALDRARLELAREIREMPAGNAKHDRMRQFASVMKDLRQLDERRPASPAQEKKNDDRRKAA